MIVNCLPLYEIPPVEEAGPPARSSSTQSKSKPGAASGTSKTPPAKRKTSTTLIKARSAEALDTVKELELHDQDEEEELQGVTNSVPVNKKWSRMSAAYSKHISVMVHTDSISSPSQGGGTTAASDKKSSEGGVVAAGQAASGSVNEVAAEKQEKGEPEEEVGKESVGEDEEGKMSIQHKEGKEEGKAEGSEEVQTNPSPQSVPTTRAESTTSRSKKTSSVTSTRSTKSASPIDEADVCSDEEAGQQRDLAVNYLDPSTMSTLRRGSGSVSFGYRRGVPRAAKPDLETSKEVDETVIEEESEIAAKPLPVEEFVPRCESEMTTPSAPPLSTPLPTTTATTATPPQGPVAPAPRRSVQVQLIPSPLPPAPPTLDSDYVENSGWLTKLSHRRGMFGDKWQKRYFVLHRNWIYYFKKYGVSHAPYPSTNQIVMPVRASSHLIWQVTLYMPASRISPIVHPLIQRL